MTPNCAQLASVAFLVPDYDQGIAFFVGGLGWTLTADIDHGHKRWVTVQPPGGGAQLVLARADTKAQTAAIGNQAGGRVWLFMHTDDFARDHARMVDAGARFEDPPRHEPYGTVAVWRDPWGNRWDLIEPR